MLQDCCKTPTAGMVACFIMMQNGVHSTADANGFTTQACFKRRELPYTHTCCAAHLCIKLDARSQHDQQAHFLNAEWRTLQLTFQRAPNFHICWFPDALQVLSNLKEVTAADSKQEESSDDDSDSEDEKEGAAAKGRKESPKASKGKANKPTQSKSEGKAGGKKKQASKGSKGSSSSSSEDSSSSEGSDSGAESDSDSDSPPAPQRVRMATHVGRYHKRERAKMATSYSANDLAAILGAAPAPEAAPGEGAGPWSGLKAVGAGRAPTPTPSGSEAEDSSSDESESESESESRPVLSGGKAGSADAPKAAKKAARDVKITKVQVILEPPPPGAWWAGMFVRAGRMGSIKSELKSKKAQVEGAGKEGEVGANGKKKILVTGFREEDQEELYEQVQHGAVHGKQGLGRAGMPKKVAGAHWCGTKTKIGSGSDSDDESGEDTSANITRDSNGGWLCA